MPRLDQYQGILLQLLFQTSLLLISPIEKLVFNAKKWVNNFALLFLIKFCYTIYIYIYFIHIHHYDVTNI